MKILALYGSPREGGNTDILTDEFARGAADSGATIIKKYLRDMEIQPCTECGACDDTGECIYDDDYQAVYNMLDDVDVLLVASPIFFYGLSAITKAFVDRSQHRWMRKYKLHLYDAEKPEEKRRGYFLSAGATKGKKVFDGVQFVMRYFFDAINFTNEEPLLFRGLDEKAIAIERFDMLKECYDAGVKAAG